MLNPARKADRETLAATLADAMTAAGATVTRQPARDYAPRRVTLEIVAPGGAHISVSIDGDSPDFVGGTWNTPHRVFLNPVLGSVNPFHYGKLNVYEDSMDRLIARLEWHLQLFASGAGYLTEEDSRIVAMRASYEAKGWAW